MAKVIVTLKIMPSGVDVNLEDIGKKASVLIKEFGGDVAKSEQVPVAFGLKSLNIMFIMNEDIGSTESLEDDIKKIKEVESVDVIDVRRTVG